MDAGTLAAGFTWAGTWFASFQDFGIDRIGPDSNGGQPTFPSWGYALNFTPSQVGGCQQQVQKGDDVVFAYDFFAEAHLPQVARPGNANTRGAAPVTVTGCQDRAPEAGRPGGGPVTQHPSEA